MAKQLAVAGTFTATGASEAVEIQRFGTYSLAFAGATATVEVERSVDGGGSWNQVPNGLHNNDTENNIISLAPGVLYRLNCTAYTSGTITYGLGSDVRDR